MRIELIAHNAVRIETNEGLIIYFDPFRLDERCKSDADIIFVTHSHFDHFSPEDIEKIKKENTKIVVTKDLVEKSIQCGFGESNVLKVLPFNEYEFGGIRFKTVPAYNTNKEFHKREYDWVGYIADIDGDKVYVAGDTDINDDILDIKCDIALVPVGGTYTMTASEAAELIRKIKPNKYAVPTHYETIVGSKQDAIDFKNMLEGTVEVNILM